MAFDGTAIARWFGRTLAPCALACALLSVAAPAQGQPPSSRPGPSGPAQASDASPPPAADSRASEQRNARSNAPKPWEIGVSESDKATASQLLGEGNRLFEKFEYLAAIARYREALQHWDHPVLHSNIAACLIQLGKPLEAYHHVERALQFGQGPLSDRLYERALVNRKNLDAQLGRITVVCKQAAVRVSLSGRPLGACPGETTIRVLPGTQEVVARKAGFVTQTRSLLIEPGQQRRIAITLVSLRDAGVVTRRWPTWVPWSVAAAGVGIALVGVPLYANARDNYQSFDRALARDCPRGCPPGMLSPRDAGLETRARTSEIASYSLFAVGGLTVATGLALLYLNQPRFVETAEPRAQRPARSRWIAPMLGRGATGLVFGARF